MDERLFKFPRGIVLAAVVMLLLTGGLLYLMVPDSQPPESVGCEGCNVVVIVLDAARRDHFGAYGYPLNTTPNIDRLAGDSFIFTNGVSQSTWTMPSIASLFTSMYPSRHRLLKCNLPDERIRTCDHLRGDTTTLAEVMGGGGYETYGFVGNPVVGPQVGLGDGFSEYVTAYSDAELADKARLRIASAAANRSKFFVYMHLMAPHDPYAPPKDYAKAYLSGGDEKFNAKDKGWARLVKMNLTGGQIRYLISQYDGEIAYDDNIVGGILDEIEANGLSDRTIVALTADHGEEFIDHGLLGHKQTPYGTLMNVPLIIHVPRAAPRRISSQVQLVDVYPTILDLTGAQVPGGLDGRSLRPLMEGGGRASPVYGEMEWNVRGYHALSMAVVDGEWKLIADFNVDGTVLVGAIDGAFNDSYVESHSMLFNVTGDAGELMPLRGHYGIRRQLFDNLVSHYYSSIERSTGESEGVELSNETVEAIRALGYFN